jgi:hypothetical protein
MNFGNPTPLRLGASGLLDGHRCRVTGRAVYGVVEHGETYYWNEFRLVDDSGDLATLVYEEAESGPTWQLFLPFTPARPIPAYEAEVRPVGQTIELEGVLATIKFKGKSFLHFLEGERSDDEHVGDVANYFNAESDNREFVVSWTDDKVECYRGKNLTAARVAEAFGLPVPQPGVSSRLFGENPSWDHARLPAPVIFAFVAVAIVVFWMVDRASDPNREVSPPAKQITAIPSLALEQPGTLDKDIFTALGQTKLEIADVERTYDAGEFNLVGVDRQPAILFPDLYVQRDTWLLLRAANRPEELTPYTAAGKNPGGTVTVDGRVFTVTRLVRFKAVGATGKSDPLLQIGAFEYGFLAHIQDQWLLVRWNESDLELFSGHPVPEREVLAAFHR